MNDKQISVDLMGDHLLKQLTAHVDENKFDYSKAILSEWIVDGQDPEDGEYEFIFINDLTEISSN